MDRIKNLFLNNFIIIIVLPFIYLIYNGYYNILKYLFLLYVISFVGFWIFAIFRSYKLKELKTVLTGSFLLKFFLIFLTIGFIFKSIYSTYPILFFGENKEKIINAFVGNSKINVRSDGSTFTSLNDNNDGIKFIYTLPNYSSTESESLPPSTSKEETINYLKKIFTDKDIRKFKNYDIYFKFLYYNQNDFLVREIKIDTNKDL
jgi:hypothetical protein